MNAWMRDNERRAAMQRRRKPGAGRTLSIPFAGLERIPFDTEPPTELHIEATGSSGEVAVWLDDFFWLDLLQHWPTRPLDIHVLPTKNALLHPVIHHQLNMLRRVSPAWRLVGHCYSNDLADENSLRAAALSVYHELQVLDGSGDDASTGDTASKTMRLEDVAAGIRTIQSANKRTTPIIVCRPTKQLQVERLRIEKPDRAHRLQTSTTTNPTDQTVATAT